MAWLGLAWLGMEWNGINDHKNGVLLPVYNYGHIGHICTKISSRREKHTGNNKNFDKMVK